jgi:hypothetical protein
LSNGVIENELDGLVKSDGNDAGDHTIKTGENNRPGFLWQFLKIAGEETNHRRRALMTIVLPISRVDSMFLPQTVG